MGTHDMPLDLVRRAKLVFRMRVRNVALEDGARSELIDVGPRERMPQQALGKEELCVT